LALHIVFVAASPDELLLSVVWDEILEPHLSGTGHAGVKITADFVVTRSTVPKLRTAVTDFYPPSLDKLGKARTVVEGLASFGGTAFDHADRSFGFTSLPSDAIGDALAGLKELSVEGTEVLLCGPNGFMEAIGVAVEKIAAVNGVDVEVTREEFTY
jgi:hypothetical protein